MLGKVSLYVTSCKCNFRCIHRRLRRCLTNTTSHYSQNIEFRLGKSRMRICESCCRDAEEEVSSLAENPESFRLLP